MDIASLAQANAGSAALLVAAVLAVGVLHTMVPDHWMPITLMARQRGWTRAQTARAAIQAGTGHVLSTLAIAAVVWLAGVAVAAKFGRWVDTVSSLALIAFGLWIAIASWLELRSGHGHAHPHGPHGHVHGSIGPDGLGSGGTVHGPELQRIPGEHGTFDLSIYEHGQSPRFRLTSSPPHAVDAVTAETLREDGSRQSFAFTQRGSYWESIEDIPEPHGFDVTLTVARGGHAHAYRTSFTEDEHHHDHRHGGSRGASSRTALLLILGSSPMVEGIPAFFAAARYGLALIMVMALVFAASTILTYVLLCVYSVASLQRVRLGAFERYGEVLSGAFIALVGLAFWLFPVL